MSAENKKKSAYAEAGVDIDVMMGALKTAGARIKATHTADVEGEMGSFGGLHKSPGSESLIVSSIDGVGTKLQVALMAGIHNTVGQCLVNHCVNDILVQGAHPLFFMDYVGTARLDAPIFDDVLSGLCKACSENGCALLGGETAEMPGLYPEGGDYDLVGAIVGTVERSKLITGKAIRPESRLIGLKSSGLHTNGYSLARKIIFEKAGLNVNDILPGTDRTVADILLAVHRSYLRPVQALMEKVTVQGLAHITGGGLVDNMPRILPDNCNAQFDRSNWDVPQVYRFMEETGDVDHDEMYRVFNMGIGMVVAVAPEDLDQSLELLKASGEEPAVIGSIKEGHGSVELIN